MSNSLTPVRDEQYITLKLKQPSFLPPILRNKSLSQLEQMADQLDNSRMENDGFDNEYGNLGHSKSMMSNAYEGYNLNKGNDADFAVRSQMIPFKKVRSLARIQRDASPSQNKNRTLVLKKNYQSQKSTSNLADGKMNPKNNYSFLNTKYFNQKGPNMNMKS